jgi:hypothetical protein
MQATIALLLLLLTPLLLLLTPHSAHGQTMPAAFIDATTAVDGLVADMRLRR